MTKKETFKNLLNELQNETEPESFKFIGTGSPMADILIVGKEAAIDEASAQTETEIESNFGFWNNTDLDNLNPDSMPSDLSYSPFYPYKGQVLNIDNGSNRGTSRTWYNYQKLYNLIFELENNEKINFHENVFITEANSAPSEKTKDANRDSISFRKEKVLSSEFFKSFPITILAGVGYFEINESKNEIEDIFDVKFTEKRLIDNKEHQPYWIHWNKDKTRLLINTYQLSMGISDNLLSEIAREIKNSKLLTQ